MQPHPGPVHDALALIAPAVSDLLDRQRKGGGDCPRADHSRWPYSGTWSGWPERSPRGARICWSAAELGPACRAIPTFAAATGLRPEEWQALQRRDIDRQARVLTVPRTVNDPPGLELGKTAQSLRQVPLSRRALEALDAIPPCLDTPLVLPASQAAQSTWTTGHGGYGHRTWRRVRSAAPRVSTTCARHSRDALAAGVSVVALARLMGTSVKMIEKHYGTLIDGPRLTWRTGSKSATQPAIRPRRRVSAISRPRARLGRHGVLKDEGPAVRGLP